MKRRFKIARKLSEDLYQFDRSFRGKFMCPACMELYDAGDKRNITDAHIVPESAGGKELTLLCRPCNSKFGSNQDRWFSEFLNIFMNEQNTIISAKSKSKYIEVNGVKVRGDIKDEEDGSIGIYLYENRNPPGKLDEIKFGSETKLRLEIPLAKKQRQIGIGYLTAAYLMWFKQMGYSWIFQSHLDEVRKQILNPNEEIISGKYLIDSPSSKSHPPMVGIVEIGEFYYPGASLCGHVVIFPTRRDAHIYESFSEKMKVAVHADFHSLNIANSHNHPGPFAVAYKTQNLVFPDHFSSGALKPEQVLYFSDSKGIGQWLRPIADSERKEIENNKDIVVKKVTVR